MKTGRTQRTVKTVAMGGTVVAVASMLLFCGCTSATRQKIASFGEPHKIEMYSGGVKVCEWESTGYVRSEENSDGYFFTDRKTGKLVKVIGDVVITVL